LFINISKIWTYLGKRFRDPWEILAGELGYVDIHRFFILLVHARTPLTFNDDYGAMADDRVVRFTVTSAFQIPS